MSQEKTENNHYSPARRSRRLQNAIDAGVIEVCPTCGQLLAYNDRDMEEYTTDSFRILVMPDHSGTQFTCAGCMNSHASCVPALDVTSTADSHGDTDYQEMYDSVPDDFDEDDIVSRW